MSLSTYSIGKSGESIASTHLINLGFKILERNWQFSHAEIDIIADNQEFIIFVEVKYRKSNTFGAPESFVSRKKQALIIRAANAYIRQKNVQTEARFDIIAITGMEPNQQIDHIPFAFYPTL